MSPLLVLRPEPGAGRTVAAAHALGLEAIALPLFVVRPIVWTPPDPVLQAVLMTSANAARHGGAGLAALVHRPLYAVGAATAAAARAAGFADVRAGGADAAAIIDAAAADGIATLLHLAGREHRAVAAPGVTIETRIVYAADAVDTPPRAMPREAVALLHSARAAAAFARLVPDRGAMAVAAISAAALEAAGGGWRTTAIASRPTDAALLAAAAGLCDQTW